MFDPSAPHIIILLVVVLLLFGSTRLPGAAKALGKSMHIFRRSVKGEYGDDEVDSGPRASQPAALPPSAPQSATEQELQDIKRRLDDLQRRSGDGPAVNGAGVPEVQRDQRTL
jgi:sec-independent protein translocase protein TatA